MKSSCTNYAVVAANAALQDFTFTNQQDGYHAQQVWGITCNVHTKHCQLNLVYKGRVISSFDCSIFADVDRIIPIELTIEAQQNAHYQFQDFTSAGDAAAGVTLHYDVPDRNV